MRIVREASIVALSLWLSACSRDANAETAGPAATKSAGPRVPVVLELFTSEGCSSCPPADEVVAALPAAPRNDNAEIIPLAFHVDYWNGLGWADPFSSSANSDRQRAYANVLGSRVYTPQAVVDGTTDVLGSDRAGLSRAVALAAKTPKADVTLAVRTEGDVLTIDATSSALAPGAEILFAVTEGHANVDVPRGENAGRTLAHAAVVRTFTSARPDAEHHARAALTIPRGMPRPAARIVAVVADTATKRVLGVATQPL